MKVPVSVIADMIKALSVTELLELRRILNEGSDGDPTNVGAVVPPQPPLRESGIANPLPEDYWETAE